MDDPASINFEDMLNWTDPDNLSLDDYKFRQFGRMGTCFIAIGLYVNVLCAKLIVPDWSSVNKEEEEEEPDEEEEEEELPPSPVWAPTLWKRSHLIWSCLCMQMFLTVVFEFSYSGFFAASVQVFIVIFKVMQQFGGVAMEEILRESLMIAPIDVMIGIVESLITMGADDFAEVRGLPRLESSQSRVTP